MERSTIVQLLRQMSDGVPGAEDRLFDVVYADMKQRARKKLLEGPLPPHDISPTTLVHETYIRLLGNEGRQQPQWHNDRQFFFIVTRAMRDILIEMYRRKLTQKRGENPGIATLPTDIAAPESRDPAVLADAVEQLKKAHPQAGDVADLRLFAGLGRAEIAEIMQISEATVGRRWKLATGFLSARLEE